MKIPTLPLPKWCLNLSKGTISSLLVTFVAVIFILACIVPAVSADTPLTASFTSSPTSPKAGDTVTFTGSSSWSNISTWSWNFGDGGSAAVEIPTHTYAVEGAYTVVLIVSNENGTASSQNPVSVSVQDAPVAAFSGTPLSGSPPLTVTFSDASTGYNITSWSWDFGDESDISTEPNPTHEYTLAGDYTVSLTASNSGGTSTPYTQSVTVEEENPLVADFDYSPKNPDANETITFTDQSEGDPDDWEWDFGDESETSTVQNLTHTYSSDGEYDVTLNITKTGGFSDTITKTITVGEGTPTIDKPVAAFDWSPKNPVFGQEVSFTDTSTGEGIDEWKWDFDDMWDFTGPRYSEDQDSQHTYERPDHNPNSYTYQVTLTVWNDGGSAIIAKPVTVRTVQLNARFNANPSSGTAPLSVKFVDSSTGTDIESYHWDFGNGQTYDGASPSNVVYSSPGSYTASLEIEDESGDIDEYTTTITVSPPAIATVAQTAAPTATPAPAEDTGFIDGEYRKMTGLYNEYISILFGFLGIDDEPDFLIIAVNTSQI